MTAPSARVSALRGRSTLVPALGDGRRQSAQHVPDPETRQGPSVVLIALDKFLGVGKILFVTRVAPSQGQFRREDTARESAEAFHVYEVFDGRSAGHR